MEQYNLEFGGNAQTVSGGETVGANLSDFEWTYAKAKGALQFILINQEISYYKLVPKFWDELFLL